MIMTMTMTITMATTTTVTATTVTAGTVTAGTANTAGMAGMAGMAARRACRGRGAHMPDDFLIRAALAGIGVALAAGPLGSFVVWRRMAYFGDATAHAAILGVALALATDLPIGAGTLVVALAMALTVSALAGRGWAMDTTLGVLAHSALAFGLVAVSFLPAVRVDLGAYLFGDILAVRPADLWFIWGGALGVLGLLVWRWSGLTLPRKCARKRRVSRHLLPTMPW